MKLMTQALQQLRKEKEALDQAIAVLEQLSRQLEKAGKSVEPKVRPSAEDARSRMGSIAKR